MARVTKALLLPINKQKEVFIQDRRGWKKPDWGFFGGGVEDGETPLAAVIREAKEELCITITPEELIPLGESEIDWDEDRVMRHFFLYPTETTGFDVKEGNGGVWLTFDRIRELRDKWDTFDEIAVRINKVLGTPQI